VGDAEIICLITPPVTTFWVVVFVFVGVIVCIFTVVDVVFEVVEVVELVPGVDLQPTNIVILVNRIRKKTKNRLFILSSPP